MTSSEQLRLARRGPLLSIGVYLLLTISKLTAGYWFHSSAILADGFNNLSDSLANVILFIGLYLAGKPADENHRFGHWKIEDLASLMTSFLMFLVGFQLLFQTGKALIFQETTVVSVLGAWIGLFSAILMFLVYGYNKHLAQKIKSSALAASAKDNLADALISLTTAIAVLTASFNLIIVDKLLALIITGLILKTAYTIFMQATFSLSDGFDQKQLKQYEAAILTIPEIKTVKSQRGRTYGSNIYLDIVLEMNPDLTVYKSHAITEQVEKQLQSQFSIYDIDIHVEPAAIPEDEMFENVVKKLYKNEMIILSKIPDFEQYIAEDFFMIEADGQIFNKDQVINQKIFYPANFTNFQIQNISQKTKLLTYTLEDKQHSSLWQRNEKWYLLYHQITKIEYS